MLHVDLAAVHHVPLLRLPLGLLKLRLDASQPRDGVRVRRGEFEAALRGRSRSEESLRHWRVRWGRGGQS